MNCSVDGCDRDRRTRGYCGTHYQRYRRNGSVIRIEREVKSCAVDGCVDRHHARGYCARHAARARRTGDPLATKRRTPVESFWARVNKAGAGGCWLWTGDTQVGGYGRISSRISPVVSGTRLTHRVAWELANGAIPQGAVLDHLCRVTACVNPEHLEPVSTKENVKRGLHGVLRTHCKRGHELTQANTKYDPKTNCRRCRTCGRASDWRAKHRASLVRQAYSMAGTS